VLVEVVVVAVKASALEMSHSMARALFETLIVQYCVIRDESKYIYCVYDVEV